MMSAVKEYKQKGGRDIAIHFVIYGDQQAFADFSGTLKSESFSVANDKQTGKRDFNTALLEVGMRRDADANEEHFGNRGGSKDFSDGPG